MALLYMDNLQMIHIFISPLLIFYFIFSALEGIQTHTSTAASCLQQPNQQLGTN